MMDADKLVKIFFDAYMLFFNLQLYGTLKIIGTKMKHMICDGSFMCLGLSKKERKKYIKKIQKIEDTISSIDL